MPRSPPVQPPHPIHKHFKQDVLDRLCTRVPSTGLLLMRGVAASPQSFFLDKPLYRDTFVTSPRGEAWIAIRYFVQNPGPFLLHCHMETHLWFKHGHRSWMAMTFRIKFRGSLGGILLILLLFTSVSRAKKTKAREFFSLIERYLVLMTLLVSKSKCYSLLNMQYRMPVNVILCTQYILRLILEILPVCL